MYRPENLSIDGTRFLGRWNGIIPVYDVLTMQGLNAIVGCVKHNNAAYGTVLYRGQTELHPKLIPSILHGNPDKVERKKREKSVDFYVDKILNDALMQGTLHFGEDLAERTNYKKIVVEAMLQHYGVRTYCHDFVDNHWTALWFSLYELKKEREKGQSKKTNYYNYYYQKRKPLLSRECPKPICLELNTVKKIQLPNEPRYEDENDPEFEECYAYAKPYEGKYQGKERIIEYIPENALHGAINELKKEVEHLKTESRIMQNIYLGVVALMFAIISILLVLK